MFKIVSIKQPFTRLRTVSEPISIPIYLTKKPQAIIIPNRLSKSLPPDLSKLREAAKALGQMLASDISENSPSEFE